MATTPEPPSRRQLLLDVDRPILMRPRRERADRNVLDAALLNNQMEFRMGSAATKPTLYLPIEKAPPAAVTIVQGGSEPELIPFAAWLLDQTKRAGMLGELAKAVKLDRRFPKNGSVEDVRRHFGSIGAEGDAFEALDDAEREYDRL
jgi:hypothetical protein